MKQFVGSGHRFSCSRRVVTDSGHLHKRFYRSVISHLSLEKLSLREIARRLGRHHTSISWEIKRNRPTYADDAVYWYHVTQPVAEKRQHKARSHRRQKHLPLVKYVEKKLRLNWPPEAIAARLQIDFLMMSGCGLATKPFIAGILAGRS